MAHRTEQELIQEAIESGSAVNLSGVVHSFSRALDELWQIARENNQGTDWVNHHEVSKNYQMTIDGLVNY